MYGPDSEAVEPQIVIIGGGFGGLAAARRLRNAPVQVTIIDRHNHHVFQPLLYQVATGELSPADIASPLRRLLKHQVNTRVLLGEVVKIDAQQQTVQLYDQRTIRYDKLIVAAGARSNYFGNSQWEEHAPGLKTIEDAVEVRRRILHAFEMAELSSDPEEIREWLTFAIIGGGPTGVEMAGALAEIAHQTFKRGFHNIDPADARIVLIQSSERILPPYRPQLSARARTMLERMGVEVITHSRVVDVSPDGLTIANGDERSSLRTRSPLWAVGVRASPLGKVLARATGVELDRGGRVKVTSYAGVPGYPDVFVIGDLAHFQDKNGKPLPGVAQVAIQQGKYVARLIEARLSGKTVPAFRYFDRGSMATIGRGAAVAQIGPLHLSGWLAWQIWLFVHLMYQLDFENRILALVQWLWNFFTGDRSALLMIDTEQPSQGAVEAKYATESGTWPVVGGD